MDKDIFDFSFDEIVSDSTDANDIREERLVEIKRYERMYLLKVQSDAELPLSNIPDDERISLFDSVVFSGFRRNYTENLAERDYSLEGCTPYQFQINSTVIEDGSWGDFLCKIAGYLINLYPEKRGALFDFRSPWTKAAMFTDAKKTNYKPIDENLYLNCNHTALHSCWLIQDILDFFGVDRTSVSLIIHRPCSAEKKELRGYIESEFKRGFKHFICTNYEKPDEYAEKVVRNIDKYLQPILLKISKSYPNFFLFDDVYIASNYISKAKTMVAENLNYDEKTRKILSKYLSYLLAFYKK